MAANNAFRSSITPLDVQAVSPALANYTKTAVEDGIWNRKELSARDRSIITVATLIARIQTIGMQHYFTKALDSGVSEQLQSRTNVIRTTVSLPING
jgi:4-carboxymuconolactone decarboxylase